MAASENPTFVCRICGNRHDPLSLSFQVDSPDTWNAISPADRPHRGELSSDTCIIDNQFFFVRGNIEIPVIGESKPFSYGAWVSLAEQNFRRCCALWASPGREKEPSYFGWLNTQLPGYPDTFNLKIRLHTRPVGERPFIELEPTAHPLAVEQRTGITLSRVQEIVERLLHPAN